MEPLLVLQPTPPSIDIYPASPFQLPSGFGLANSEIFLTVRARVNTTDHDGAQELLLDLVDPDSDSCLTVAIEEAPTLGGSVSSAWVSDGPSEFGIFPDPAGAGDWLGCTWTVRVFR